MINDYGIELPRFSVALRGLCGAGVSILNGNGSFEKLYSLFRKFDDVRRARFGRGTEVIRDICRVEASDALDGFIKESTELNQDPDLRWHRLITETVRRFCVANPSIPVESWLHLRPNPSINAYHRMAYYNFLDISRQVVAEECGKLSHDFTDDSSESLDEFFAELQTITV